MLNKRIEDLEKASVYPPFAKERKSQMKQTHEPHINVWNYAIIHLEFMFLFLTSLQMSITNIFAFSQEKYEKDLEDTKAREQNYARNAAILAKVILTNMDLLDSIVFNVIVIVTIKSVMLWRIL